MTRERNAGHAGVGTNSRAICFIVLSGWFSVYFIGMNSPQEFSFGDNFVLLGNVAGANRVLVDYCISASDRIARVCTRYGSDKGSASPDTRPYSWAPHSYSHFYQLIFGHRRHSVTRVFECGIGTNNPSMPSSMGPNGIPGASLRVWRDFFPNATVYGADIDAAVLFSEERIETRWLDQTSVSSIEALWADVGQDPFEVMIDDGLHTFEAGSTLLVNSLPHLDDAGIYIIEDVGAKDLPLYWDFLGGLDVDFMVLQMSRSASEVGDNSLIHISKTQG